MSGGQSGFRIRVTSFLSRQDLIRGGVAVLGLKTSAAALGFANGVILARLLSLEAYGILAQVVAAAATLATILTLGTPSLLTREIASQRAHGRWSPMKGMIYWAFRRVLLVCFAALLVSLFLLLFYAPVAWRIPGTFGLVMAIFLAINLLRAAVLRGLGQVIIADIPETLIQPLTVLVLIGLTFHFASQEGVVWAVTLQLAGVLFALLFGLLFLYKSWPSAYSKAAVEVVADQWNGPTTIFFLIAGLSIVEGQIAVLLAGALAGPAQAGLFQAGNRLVMLVVLGLLAVNAPLMPRLAAAWAMGDRLQSQALVTQAAKIGTIVALLIALPLLVFPDWFLGLFGEAYKQGTTAVRILVLGQLVNAVSGPCGLVLTMTGHQSKALWALAIAIVVNLLTNLWLTKDLGVIGAATAVTASLIIWNVLMSYWSWKHTRINTSLFWKIHGH